MYFGIYHLYHLYTNTNTGNYKQTRCKIQINRRCNKIDYQLDDNCNISIIGNHESTTDMTWWIFTSKTNSYVMSDETIEFLSLKTCQNHHAPIIETSEVGAGESFLL